MPPPALPRRLARTKQLIRHYYHAHKAFQTRLRQRKRQLLRCLRQAGAPSQNTGAFSDSDSSLSSLSDFTSSSSGSSSSSDSTHVWEDILGPDWCNQHLTINSSASLSDIIPELFPCGFTDTDSTDSTSSSSDLGSDNGVEAVDDFESDIEMLDCDADDEESVGDWEELSSLSGDRNEYEPDLMYTGVDRWARLRHWTLRAISEMFSERYEAPRDPLPRGPSFLHHILLTLKNARPDHFRQELRVTPKTFDAIVSAIEANPIFFNNSNNAQQPVEEQLAITLYRFGHDGNGASLQSVANWAAVGKGTVLLATRRVMTAVLCPEFMERAVRYPTEAEKKEAKRWVRRHSCKAWQDGWCMVDGTLVPLAERPHWFGESYFDRKNRYSLSFQIVSLPNLRIIDFTYGHTGSTHDSTAWQSTRLASNEEDLLAGGEWVWADSAYPISTHVVAPYKKPARDLPDNEVFNNHVSMVRIRSEHAIGFLKGRFHSLKNLRLRINDKEGHIVATYWVSACIGLHSFAMQCEEAERDEEEGSFSPSEDPFIAEGLSASSDDDLPAFQVGEQSGRTRLQAGKAFRESLKAKLFEAKQQQAAASARRRAERLGVYSDSDTS